VFKKLGSTSLVVSTDSIERIGGKSKEFIKYSDIKKFKIKTAHPLYFRDQNLQI